MVPFAPTVILIVNGLRMVRIRKQPALGRRRRAPFAVAKSDGTVEIRAFFVDSLNSWPTVPQSRTLRNGRAKLQPLHTGRFGRLATF